MTRLVVLLFPVLMLSLLGPQHAAARPPEAMHQPAAQLPAADTPSPTLGSTPQPGVDRPNDNDGDPADFNQVPLVVISFLSIFAIVGLSLLYYLWRRSRRG